MSTKHLLVLLLAVVLLTTHSLADHHNKPPHKPPHKPPSAEETSLDGKPYKGSKPPPKHKPPTSLDGFQEEKVPVVPIKPPQKEQPVVPIKPPHKEQPVVPIKPPQKEQPVIPIKPPHKEQPVVPIKPPHKPPSESSTLEQNLDGKPYKGSRPPPKHKPPTPN
uniref:Proline-rich protein n=1 Tax=Fagus sylvatica TaxID=28930 RepID=A0A2N9HE17_FAGSY